MLPDALLQPSRRDDARGGAKHGDELELLLQVGAPRLQARDFGLVGGDLLGPAQATRAAATGASVAASARS